MPLDEKAHVISDASNGCICLGASKQLHEATGFLFGVNTAAGNEDLPYSTDIATSWCPSHIHACLRVCVSDPFGRGIGVARAQV